MTVRAALAFVALSAAALTVGLLVLAGYGSDLR